MVTELQLGGPGEARLNSPGVLLGVRRRKKCEKGKAGKSHTMSSTQKGQ